MLLYTNTRFVGGMEEHIELIARHLDRRRFEVFSICPALDAVKPFAENLQRYSDHFAAITFDRFHLQNWPVLMQQIRDWKIDVMHMHNGYYRGQNLSYLAAFAAGVRKVYITEHLAPEQREMRHHELLRNFTARIASGIICVSEKNYLARKEFLYTPPDRTFIVKNGVDLDDFTPIPEPTLAELRARYSLPEDAEVVGTMVRFESNKGLEYLVDAMVKIRAARPKAYLLMVGDGSLRGELEAQVERVGLKEFTRFTGFQTEPRPFFGLMDAFVLPVPIGSMSIALLEAMAMSRAVVITFGGKGEAVIHEQTGLCAEPRNSSSIAESVIRILESKSFKEQLGQAARKHVEEEFSAATTARRLEEIYQRNLTRS
ncbi:MAG TPA: glycosyltransferase family 4 protein [Polyangiaceae bacterium]|nr:glycosyltransferase family 4 protein [Polyangiaceae bacterium]